MDPFCTFLAAGSRGAAMTFIVADAAHLDVVAAAALVVVIAVVVIVLHCGSDGGEQ